MINLYFVRHGQTEWNKKRILQGHKDSPLTQEGIEQAGQLKSRLSSIPITKCITSPLGRARQTVELLLPASVPVIDNALITEMQFGEAEGLEKELFKQRYPQAFHNLWHHAEQYDPMEFSGETFQSMIKRGQKFLESLTSEQAGESILVISHGMILKIIFALIWDHNLERFWDDPVPLNTSLTHVILKENTFEIVDFSNVSHLSDTEVISYV